MPGDSDFRSDRSQPVAHGFANAAVAACNQGNFAIQTEELGKQVSSLRYCHEINSFRSSF
jgi:hypothetical protein